MVGTTTNIYKFSIILCDTTTIYIIICINNIIQPPVVLLVSRKKEGIPYGSRGVSSQTQYKKK